MAEAVEDDADAQTRERNQDARPRTRRMANPHARRKVWSGPTWTAPVTFKEVELHRAVAKYLEWCLAPPAMFTTFPSGWGKLGKAMAGILRDCGLRPGMPDMMIFYGGRTIGLELKRPKGRLSRNQSDTIERLHKAGVPVFTCRSLSDVEKLLKQLDIPLCGKIAA